MKCQQSLRYIREFCVSFFLENRVNERCHHRPLSKYDKCSHQHNRDDQWCQPILLADFQKVPNVFDQIKKGFHGSKDASEISFVVLSVFSVSFFAFSTTSQWVISFERKRLSYKLKDQDKDQIKDDVTINLTQVITKYHPTIIWLVKNSKCCESKN